MATGKAVHKNRAAGPARAKARAARRAAEHAAEEEATQAADQQSPASVAQPNLATQDPGNPLNDDDIPALALDAGWRLRRFTPAAGALLNLAAGDVGRPFSEFASTLNLPDWKALFTEVSTHKRLVAREVADRAGHWYSMRLRPDRADGDATGGVLVTLFDVDLLTSKIREARESRDRAFNAGQRNESILNSLASHVAVIARDGKILTTNEAWNRFARENSHLPLRAVGPGANYLEVCRQAMAKGDPDAEQALDRIGNVLAGRSILEQMEYACHSPAEQRWFLMSVSPLRGDHGGVVIAHLNITSRKIAEVAANRSESAIRALLESSILSVVVEDENHRIVLVNGKTEETFGYSREELLGQPLTILVPEKSRIRHLQYEKEFLEGKRTRPMSQGFHLEGRRKDGTVIPIEIGLSSIETIAGRLVVAFISDITERRRLEEAERAHVREVQALAARLLTAQEDERRRVSRELHDQICQQLASIAIDLSGFAALPPPPAGERERRIRSIQMRVVKASEATRHIAYQLHPSVLDDLGVVASLRALCKEFGAREKLSVEFDNGAMPAEISREVASCIYRVAQEGLNNIARHSGARRVSVTLNLQNGLLVLTISDDGTGFDRAAAKGKGGLGLVGMEERARLVNGTLSITSRPRRGTQIALSVPLTPGL